MTTFERALQIWQILVSAAHNRQVLTYEIVSDFIGLPAPALGAHLKHIMNYCEANKLPPLTVLVVGKTTGLAGDGLTTSTDLHRDRERVFAHNWFGMKPLAIHDLTPGPKKREHVDVTLGN